MPAAVSPGPGEKYRRELNAPSLAANYVSSLAFDRKTLQPVSAYFSVRRSSTAPVRREISLAWSR